ncbi:intercellular trafficking and secretion [Polyrhizophydium stewartii]|uniref:Sorting nexin-4 n=1 Tax=Polyrhizophydium stewartii TaxID=2732419 RepID=A0ABR4NKD3_9FUNG
MAYAQVSWDTAPDTAEGVGSSSRDLSPGSAPLTSFDAHIASGGPSGRASASSLLGPRALSVVVSDPQKHGEGSSAFVSYLIRTRTTIDSFKSPEPAVRRRFQDFVTLHKLLADAHAACILPPLPGKHRMEYITGDRFSPEFIEKRRASLQTYIDRISRHPVLMRSPHVQRFLEAEQMSAYDLPKRETHVFENISDVFLNAFSKVRKPDERFTEIKESIDKFEQNLINVEKMHSRLLKFQMDLATDLADFGSSLTSLGMMETQISQPLTEFGNRIPAHSQTLKEKTFTEEQDYVTMLREYVAYSQSVKDVLKARDQKQVDHEELSNWLLSHQSDRDRTMSTGKSPGIAGFFKDKINDLKGVDPEKARQMRLVKLEAKIQELQEAVGQSSITSEAFSKEVLKEIEAFQVLKVHDFKLFLRDYVDAQLNFHERGFNFWSGLLPVADSISLETPVKSAQLDETDA